MSKSNHAQLFIRLLRDAILKDRLRRNEALEVEGKTRAQRFIRRRQPGMNNLVAFAEPPDCVQMMGASDHGLPKF